MNTETVRYRYRAYPDKRQQRMFSRLFGCTRLAYNDALAYCRASHAAGTGFPADIQKVVLTDAKKTPERAFLNQVYGVCLIQSVNDAKAAYRNFFNSRTGSRKGRPVGLPRYKSRKDNHDSARFTRAARFSVSTGPEPTQATLALPGGLGAVAFVMSRPLPSTPSSVTVLREPDGRYYLSFVVTREVRHREHPTGRIAGIDVGLSSYAHIAHLDTTTGQIRHSRIDTPAYLRRKERALARSQRCLARKKPGSKNRGKARVKVAVLHRKIRHARADHAHQSAAALVKDHDIIAIESFTPASLAKTTMAKSAADQGLGQFLALLAEKAARTGTILVKVDRWYPSTQECSTCAALTGPRGRPGLKVRRWTCTQCNTTHDRDINAATNILNEGLRVLATTTPVADGQSETQNALGREAEDAHAASRHGRSTPDDPGRTTGDLTHAAA